MSDRIGQQLGNYRLVSLLGRGGLADVYLGEHLHLGTQAALKVFRTRMAQRDLETFLDEARTLVRLQHPHIVRVLEVGAADERTPFIVMEYAPQGTIRQRFPGGTRVSPEAILPYVRHIADALHYAHQQGHIHRGVKPENFLLGQKDEIFLSDFGIAVMLQSIHSQRYQNVAGTAGYMAPEQIQGQPSPASDQYALGSIIYEWLSGSPPFTGSFAEITSRHLHTPPTSLRECVSSLPQSVDQVLSIALAKDPAARFASVHAFAVAFEQACRPESTAQIIVLQQPPSLKPETAPTVQMNSPLLTRPLSSMPSVPQLLCQCCGRLISGQAGEDCPSCGYPIQVAKERLLLEALLKDLQRIAQHGGANVQVAGLVHLSEPAIHALRRVASNNGAHISVTWLIQRYQMRLRDLEQLQRAQQASASEAPLSGKQPAPTDVNEATSQGIADILPSLSEPQPLLPNNAINKRAAPSSTVQLQPSVVPGPTVGEGKPHPVMSPSSPTVLKPAPEECKLPPVIKPSMTEREPQPVNVQSTRVMPVPRPPRPSPVAALRPLLDSSTGLMVALGTFLILIAILGLPFLQSLSGFAFLATIGAQIFFALMAIITRRSTRFREFSRIYSIFFAFTIPLLVYDVLLQKSGHITPPALIAIAALYAAITYGAFAIYQRFSPFGYLSMTAFIVAGGAFTIATSSASWAAPMFMLLALLALFSIQRDNAIARSHLERLFVTSWAMLRSPVRIYMFIIAVAVAVLYVPVTTFLILQNIIFNIYSGGGLPLFSITLLPLSLFATLLLLLIWLCLYIRRTRWGSGHYLVASLFLLCLLSLVYTLALPSTGSDSSLQHAAYGLALLGAAALYHGINRFAPDRFQLYLKPGLFLDLFALTLLGFTPLLDAPNALLQLLSNIPVPSQVALPLPQSFITILTLGAGCLLTISITVSRANASGTAGAPVRQGGAWPWLLVFIGMLFNWAYATAGTALSWLQVNPLWWFLPLTLMLTLLAILVRSGAGSRWSNPLDALILSEAVFTLSMVGQGWRSIEFLLLSLFFAALFYGVLLYQRRAAWLFVSLIFAIAALPGLILDYPQLALLLALALPLASTAIHHLMPARTRPGVVILAGRVNVPLDMEGLSWDWPLFSFALICGAAILMRDALLDKSAVSAWLGLPFPLAGEIAVLALAWYVSAGLARARWWLLPAGTFASAALVLLFLRTQDFLVLAAVVPVTASLGLVVSRLTGRIWALPSYAAALLSAVLAGMAAGLTPPLLPTAAWVLPGFAVIASLVGALEALPEVFWLIPVFTTWSTIGSMMLYARYHASGDLYHLPAVAMLSITIEVALGRLCRLRPAFATPGGRRRLLRYLAPFYAAALAAALVTGLYSTFGGNLTILYSTQLTIPVLKASLSLILTLPELLIFYAVVAYLALLVERRSQWLWLAAGFYIWGRLLGVHLSPNTTVIVGITTGLIGLVIHRIRPQARSRVLPGVPGLFLPVNWPWYGITVAATILTGVQSFSSMHPGVEASFTTYSLLALAALLYIVSLVERRANLTWLASAFGGWALLDFMRQGAVAPLIIMAVVCVTLGVAMRLPARLHASGAAHRDNRLAHSLPFYAMALLAAILTGISFNYSAFDPLRQVIPAVLLGYAVIAYLVLAFERLPEGFWLVTGFGIWSVILGSFSNVPGAPYALMVGLVICMAGMLLRLIGPRVQSTWLPFLEALPAGWPWYAIALAAAVLTGVHAPAAVTTGQLPFSLLTPPGIGMNAIDYTAYGLLAFAALFYLTSLVERQATIAWLAFALAGWALLDLISQGKPLPLIGVALACAVTGVASRLIRRLHPPPVARRNPLLDYSLPLYATALLAAILTGICFYLSVLDPLHQAVPAVLLGYALVAFLVLVYESLPEGFWLVAGFGIWGTILSVQTSSGSIFGIAIGAAIGAVLADRLMKRPRRAWMPAALQAFARLSWGWSWFLIAVAACIIAGIFPPPWLASHVPDSGEYSLFGSALLIYVTGIAQDQPFLLYTAPCFAIWSLYLAAGRNDLLHLFIVSLVCVAIALVLGLPHRSQRRSASDRRSMFLKYALPFYTTAFAAALLIGLEGMYRFSISGYAGGILLIYSAVTCVTLFLEYQPRLTGLIAGFGVWGLLLVPGVMEMQSAIYPMFGTYVDSGIVVIGVGVGAGIVGLLTLRRPTSAHANTGHVEHLTAQHER